MNFSSILSLLTVTVAAATANPFAAKSANNAKSAFVGKLMRGAKPTKNSARKLNEEFVIDLTPYSVKFEKCQFIKSYSDEYAQNEDAETVLETQRFVLFKLCPEGSCGYCNANYGEYMIDLETYLESAVQYYQEEQENMCKACDECQNENADEDADENDGGRRLADVDCSSCYDECQKIENMEENGYIDATNFLECQMIYDPEDDAKGALYAGPMCASSGSKIKIGVFSDEECNTVLSNKSVENYLVDGDGYTMKLSTNLLSKTYDADSCISCLAVDEDGQDDDGKEAEAIEMCQELYEGSAKCETVHGFTSGYNNYYSNQYTQEESVCNYIESIESGTFDDEGEISIYGANSVAGGGATTTGGQKFALTFFVLGTVGLTVYAAMLHNKLTKGAKAGLTSQGGAMA